MPNRYRYQLNILGHQSEATREICERISVRLAELQIVFDSLEIVTASTFESLHKNNVPNVTLYFGEAGSIHPDLEILSVLMSYDSSLVLPLVASLDRFGSKVPTCLRPINGIDISSAQGVERAVNCVLEGFGLLRKSRRLFISYKRTESTGVAVQLYERFQLAGFQTFLDTCGVGAGQDFQKELMHQLADSDIVVLLNTKTFTASDWGMKEFAQASMMQIRLAQLIWPRVSPIPTSELTERRFMKAADFRSGSYVSDESKLNNSALEQLIVEVESLRARSLAARQDNLVTTFMRRAIRAGVQASIQPYKYIKVSPGSRKRNKVVIPTVGVPQAFNYDESRNRIRQILSKDRAPIYLLFDQLNVKEAWLEHLAWLDRYLPVKTVQLDRSEEWLRNL